MSLKMDSIAYYARSINDTMSEVRRTGNVTLADSAVLIQLMRMLADYYDMLTFDPNVLKYKEALQVWKNNT